MSAFTPLLSVRRRVRAGESSARRAALATLLCAIGALLIASAPANATLASFAPVDPATGFPASYADGAGLSLDLCLDGPPSCLAATADLVGAAPGGEAFWWHSSAELTSPRNGSRIQLFLAVEAAFGGGAPDGCLPGACDEISFSRIRFAAPSPGALVAGATYTVTHPFGTDTFKARADGTVPRSAGTKDIGCFPVFPAKCDFGLAMTSRVGPFLRWDPAVAPAAPAGFIGDALTPHKVIGSPTGNNVFKVEGPGLPVGGLVSDLFTVQGKVSPPVGPPAPRVTFVPGSQVFGTQKVNTTGAAKTITVNNSGTADLSISAVGLTGADAAQFAIASNGCAAPTVLAPGAACSVDVTFRPTSTGAKSASLTVTDNAAGSPHSAALTGTGAAPQIAVSPASLSFGNQRVFTFSNPQTVTVSNPGAVDLVISGATITGTNPGDFTIQTETCAPWPRTLAPGASCTLSIVFRPQALLGRSANLNIASDAGATKVVPMTGNGSL